MSSSKLQRPIENPTLELKIVSASDVSHIDATDKMDIYAVVTITGDTCQKKQAAKTPIDYDGGSNPTWNHTVKFSINEEAARNGLLTVNVKLYSYWLEGENDVFMGEVDVSVQELLASNPIPRFTKGNVNKMKSLTCPVKVTGGESNKATLTLSYRFKPLSVNDSPLIGQTVYRDLDPAKLSQPMVFPPQFQIATTKMILELVIKFAKDIEDVSAFSAMDVYASVAILKDKKVKDRINTHIDFAAYKNPNWNHAMKFSLDEKLGQEGRLILIVELMSHRPFLGDKEIGFVRIPIQQLLASNPPSPLTNDDANGMKLETHPLTGPYGKKGIVSLTYRFLTQQVTVPPPSITTPQPYIIYLQPDANVGSSNGLVPIYMPPQYSPRQQKPKPQLPQSLPDTQSHPCYNI